MYKWNVGMDGSYLLENTAFITSKHTHTHTKETKLHKDVGFGTQHEEKGSPQPMRKYLPFT